MTSLEVAFQTGQTNNIQRILVEIELASVKATQENLCPVCFKELDHKPLVGLRVMAMVCPNHHGVSLSTENAQKIRELFLSKTERIMSPNRSIRYFFLGVILIVSLLGVWLFESTRVNNEDNEVRSTNSSERQIQSEMRVLAESEAMFEQNQYESSDQQYSSSSAFNSPQGSDSDNRRAEIDNGSQWDLTANPKFAFSMHHPQNVSPQYWPARDFSQWNVLPARQNVIIDSHQLEYFQTWIDLLNEGIINRLNMNDALLANRPVMEYGEVFDYYAQLQNGLLDRLRELNPPENLQVFHQYVVDATVDQIQFYEDFVRQKMNNPQWTFNQMREHPQLRSTDQKLWAANYEFRRIYPQRDPATNNAIEQRLCWMDMI